MPQDKQGREIKEGDRVIATFNSRTQVAKVTKVGRKSLMLKWKNADGKVRSAKVVADTVTKFTRNKKPLAKPVSNSVKGEYVDTEWGKYPIRSSFSRGKLATGDIVELNEQWLKRTKNEQGTLKPGDKGIVQTFTRTGVVVLFPGKKVNPNVSADYLRRCKKQPPRIC